MGQETIHVEGQGTIVLLPEDYIRPTMHFRINTATGTPVLQQLWNHHEDRDGFGDGLWKDVPTVCEP